MAASIYEDGSYLSSNPTWHSERAGWKAKHVVEGLAAAGVKPQTLCDIGCGTGLALARVAQQLPDVTRAVGFEPSSDAPQHEDSVGVIEYRREDATQSTDHFDCAMMLDVFEHVEDPYGFLRSCAKLADYFAFHIPLDANCMNILRNGFMGPRRASGHLHYYTDLSARLILQDVGYEVLHTHFTKAGWEGAGRNPNGPLNLMRRAMFPISQTQTHRLLGGVAYLVICKAPKT